MTAPIRTVSGMPVLVAGVKAYFAAIGRGDISVVYGYRQRAQQLNQGTGGANRVCFLPGDPNGNGGKIGASPRDVGRREVLDVDGVTPVGHIRPLASWERIFTVSIWAFDNSSARDELVQDAAVESLFELTMQAIEQLKGAGGPNVAWGATQWTVTKENTFGAELLVGLELAHPLMDAPEEIGFPGFTLHRVGTGT